MTNDIRVKLPSNDFLPTDVDGFDLLAELALDLRWSWNHSTDEVWRLLDSTLWELTQNPWVVLQTVSREQLRRMLADPAFRKKAEDLRESKRRADAAPGLVSAQSSTYWLNTPRRPWEACGTSGMKVLVRGINVSELDGWWAEAYEPDIGWALGDGEEHTDDRDGNEAEQLYSVLERGVIPESYSRHDEGIPNRLGGTDQGKHGSAIDPELLRESYGPRVYRATLPSGRCCIPIPYCK